MDEDDECGSWQWVPVVAVIKPEGRETWVPVFLWPRPESPGPPLTGKVRRGSGTPCDGHWSHLYWGVQDSHCKCPGSAGHGEQIPIKVKKTNTQLWV